MKLKKHFQKVLFPPQKYKTVEKDHGRIEHRAISVVELKPGQSTFPFSNQAFKVERIFTDFNDKTISSETIFGITSLRPNEAGPQRLLEYNRGHWCIENKVHYVRDVTMFEDSSRVRKGSGPRMLAILKNIALNILRSNGVKNISSAIQNFAFNKKDLFCFAGLAGATR